MQAILMRAAFLLVAATLGFGAGYRISTDHHKAQQLDQALAYAKGITDEQERADNIVEGYGQVVAWLQRRNRSKSEEIIRETEKPDYRCPLPEPGRLLIRAAIRDANLAGAGAVGGEVRDAP